MFQHKMSKTNQIEILFFNVTLDLFFCLIRKSTSGRFLEIRRNLSMQYFTELCRNPSVVLYRVGFYMYVCASVSAYMCMHV